MNVTITGADDNTDVRELADLSAEFPFVEWGILRSAKREGTPRYPSQDWIGRLFSISSPMRIAGHLCGRDARDFISGSVGCPLGFDRVQINGWPADGPSRPRFDPENGPELILQCRTEADLQHVANHARDLGNASVLFDPSGGRGLLAFKYPPTPYECKLGFAGGIGPDNVLDVIGEICVPYTRPDDAWIDMESGVRDAHDMLDLGRVRIVLEHVAGLRARRAAGKAGR